MKTTSLGSSPSLSLRQLCTKEQNKRQSTSKQCETKKKEHLVSSLKCFSLSFAPFNRHLFNVKTHIYMCIYLYTERKIECKSLFSFKFSGEGAKRIQTYEEEVGGGDGYGGDRRNVCQKRVVVVVEVVGSGFSYYLCVGFSKASKLLSFRFGTFLFYFFNFQ